MKKLIAIAFLIISSFAMAQDVNDNTKPTATVRVVQGYEVYIFSEPTKPYIEVTTVKSGASSGMVSPNIEKMVRVICKKIAKAERKVGQIDGFITSDGNTVRCIVFK